MVEHNAYASNKDELKTQDDWIYTADQREKSRKGYPN